MSTATSPADASKSAEAVVAATFQAHVDDAISIQDQLDALWSQLGDPSKGRRSTTGGLDRDDRDQEQDRGELSGEVLLRADTLNLIAVAHSRREGYRIEQAIAQLDQFYPARALILLSDPGENVDPVGLDVRIELRKLAGERGRPTTCFECVKVAGSAAQENRLATIASPLLIAELPDFLWWPGTLPETGELFDDLSRIMDRIIVDSARFDDPAVGLTMLSRLSHRGRNAPALSDFTWFRLNTWRQLVAQFFDQPRIRPSLDCLDEVTITYQPRPDPDAPSGFASALLMAGWLASRLQWVAEGPPERTRRGHRIAFRYGERQRQVILKLVPQYDSAFRHLGAVILTARHEHPGRFSIERPVAAGLKTTSETPDTPPVSRMVLARRPDDASLLSSGLKVFSRDQVYEEALQVVAELYPGKSA